MQQHGKWSLLGAAAILLSGLSWGIQATEKENGPKRGQAHTEPQQEMVARLIVKPLERAGAKLAQALQAGEASGLAMAAQVGLSVVRPMSGGAHVLMLDQAVSLEEAREIAVRMKRNGGVEYAEPDRIVTHTAFTPSDPLYDSQTTKQWHYFIPAGANQGGASLPNAWHQGFGSNRVVAVLDTGHVLHQDLAALTLSTKGYDFVSYAGNGDGDGWDSDPTDPGDNVAANECGYPHAARSASWHGLHVSGTIAALMNDQGGAGIAPAAEIVPVRVLGRCGGYMSDVADAMRWAAGLFVSGTPRNPAPADVLNLSLGASGTCSHTLGQAVEAVLGAGKIIVASAGNDGAAALSQPANCSGVLAVTAHAIDGDNADYSNIGAAATISAPGGGCGTLASFCVPNNSANGLGVISTFKTGQEPEAKDYASKYGTSMAAPHVTGVVALMLQVHHDEYPLKADLTPAEVKSHLQSSASAHPANTLCRQSRYLGLCGEGLLNADGALQKVMNAAPTLSLDNAYQVVAPGAPVTLAGRGQADSTYVWTQSYGSPVGLSGTTATAGEAKAYFTAPASGTYSFQLEARRGDQSGKATATVRVNSAPSLTAMPAQSVVAGSGLSFRMLASDGEGDSVSFYALSLPSGASLSTNGSFSWPSAMPVGTHTVSYYAMDDAGSQSAAGRVEIVVTAGGRGGGGGSLGWPSLLILGVLAAGWRRHRAAAGMDTRER